jgi:hypothetical protein
VVAGMGNDGVDINLIHGFDYLRINREKFAVMIELGKEDDATRLYAMTNKYGCVSSQLHIYS